MSTNTIQCPFCQTVSNSGLRVCPGSNCGATIIYGATDKELQNAFTQSGSITFISLILLQLIGPTLINGQFNLNIPQMFGLGFYGVIASGVLAWWMAVRSRASSEASMSGLVRFFRFMPRV